jgi:hypothetical protein
VLQITGEGSTGSSDGDNTSLDVDFNCYYEKENIWVRQCTRYNIPFPVSQIEQFKEILDHTSIRNLKRAGCENSLHVDNLYYCLQTGVWRADARACCDFIGEFSVERNSELQNNQISQVKSKPVSTLYWV